MCSSFVPTGLTGNCCPIPSSKLLGYYQSSRWDFFNNPNAARITWTTDIPGSTQVEFGLKKSYGKKTAPDNLPRLKHFNWSCNKLHHNGTHAMRVDALVDSYIYNNTFSDNSPKRGDSEITGTCRNVTFYKNSGARYVNAKGDGLLFLRNKFPYIRTGGGLATVRDAQGEKFDVRTDKGEMVVEFTDGKVFARTVKHSSGKYSMTEPEYLPGGSRFQMEAGAWATSHIIAYPLCAVPEKGEVKITDVTLSPLSFTANTKDGNKVTFTAEGLKPGGKYVVKTAGKVLIKAAADKAGKITFTHSDWKQARKFTVEPAEEQFRLR